MGTLHQESFKMKVVLLLLVTLGLSTAQDCLSTYFNERCLPKAEAGWAAHHSALFQDGDPCFTYASFGSMCYVGGGVLHPCDMTAPGCSGSGWSATTTTTQAPVVNGGGDCPNQAAYCALGDDNTMCKYCGIGDTCNDQLWADQCPDGSWVVSDAPPHDPNRNTIVYDGHIGQNMADSWNSVANMDWGLSTKVQSWYDEVKDWPAAKVGSGVIYYRDQADWAASYPYRKSLTCNYWPGGNFMNQPVYQEGTTAAACTNGSENGLCL